MIPNVSYINNAKEDGKIYKIGIEICEFQLLWDNLYIYNNNHNRPATLNNTH